jgi:hypothetical protein
LSPEAKNRLMHVAGLEGMVEEVTLSIDEVSGGGHEARALSSRSGHVARRRQITSLSRRSFHRQRPPI